MRNKKGILIIIPILIILIITAIIAILYFTTDLFKSNQELFWKYFAQSNGALEIINNDKASIQMDFKQNNSYISTGNLFLTKEFGETSSKQLNVATNSRHDANTGRTYSDAILKNGDLDLFKVSYVNNGDVYAIRCDEVFPNYVGIQNSRLKEMASNYNLPNAENFPDSVNINEYTNILDMTDEQEKHLLDAYLPIIMSNIAKDQYTKSNEQITIDFGDNEENIYTFDTNVYKVSISSESMKNIIIDCLNYLKSDTETLMLISNKLQIIGFGMEYTDTANLSLKIDELIVKVQDLNIEENFNISVYENNGELVRTNISINNECTIIYDKVSEKERLTIEIANEELQNIIENNNEETENIENGVNDIIDLNDVNSANGDNISTIKIVLTKDVGENITTNEIRFIPNTDNEEQNIIFRINMGTIQDNNINNNYTFIINNINDEKREVTTITYDKNISKVDQVEQIEELTVNNTAIANNYDAETFKNFFNAWLDIFQDKLIEKMISIGFDELADI